MRLVELSSQRSKSKLITELRLIILHDKLNCFDSVKPVGSRSLGILKLTTYKNPQNLLVVLFDDLQLAY